MGNCKSCINEQEKHDVTIEGNRKLAARHSTRSNTEKSSKDNVVDFELEANFVPIVSSLKGWLLRKGFREKKRGYTFQKDIRGQDLLKYTGELRVEVDSEDYRGRVEELLPPIVKKLLKELPAFEYPLTVKQVLAKGPIKLQDGNVYVGEWMNSARFGKGKMYSSDGTYMEGYWKNGQLDLRGRVVYFSGDYYEGEFREGVREGIGKLISLETLSSYEGEWQEDRQHGIGTEHFSENSSTYVGQFERGVKSGHGKFQWSDGSWFEGHFNNNKLDGQGHYVWSDQREYIGEWRENKMHGKGKFIWPDGRLYEGDYRNDKKEGYGVYRWENGKVYEGEWLDGRMHGDGFLTVPGKPRKKFIFAHGKKTASNEEGKANSDE